MLLGRCVPERAAPTTSSDPCPVMLTLAATALYDRMPPPDATPEAIEAIEAVNADMSRVRAEIEEACRGR